MTKISTQLAIVIAVGVLGFVGLVLGLAVLADWSDGAIIGMGTAFGAIIVNTIIAIRNQQKTAEVLGAQDEKLDTIKEQTNGHSDAELRSVARYAVQEARERPDGVIW